MAYKKDRTVLDHLADLPDGAPDHRHTVAAAFQLGAKRGWSYTYWSVDAAIRTHNHLLLCWLMHQDACREGGPAHLADEARLWVAVHSRNQYALGWCPLPKLEHFEQVALEDDTAFLGHMRAEVKRRASLGTPVYVNAEPFRLMIDDLHDQGEAGFLWLWRNRMIDRSTLRAGDLLKIRTRYGRRLRKKKINHEQ